MYQSLSMMQLMALCCALVAGDLYAADPFIGCPGQTFTLRKHRDPNNNLRICVKAYGERDRTPVSVEVWTINPVGNSSWPKQTGSFCYWGSKPQAEFRIGAFDKPALVYWNEWPTAEGFQPTITEEQQLAKLIVPPVPVGPNGSPVTRLDPCRPECEQTPAPRMSATAERRACLWTCGATGQWHQVCPKLGSIDPKTGRKVTIED